ncbi:MAG: lipopolysaccharide transport system permease protein [Maribacter sp.]|jgi:lipopolysaccharide transport system permease protein
MSKKRDKHIKVRIIEDKPVGLAQYLMDIWDHRHLVVSLTRRELKIKYAQTALGLVWVLLQPLTGLIIFTVFFDLLIQVDTGDVPYPLFAFSGLLAWYFFAYTVQAGGVGLISSGDLIKKVYFPKMIIILSKTALGFIDFLIGFILMAMIMFFYGVHLHFGILFLPLVMIFNAITGFSLALWLSALTVRNRDFQHIIPYLVNFGIWLTPVFYPGTLIPDDFQWALYLNPMAAVVAGYRWSLLGDVLPNVRYLLSIIPIIILFFSGFWYFRKVEDDIADYI